MNKNINCIVPGCFVFRRFSVGSRQDIDEQRLRFITDCEMNDAKRMADEEFPEGVVCYSDIPYKGDNQPAHLLDYYISETSVQGLEAYLLIHGGAFVYGYKELDKNFGMRLALASDTPVISINYSLLPEGSLETILDDIDAAIRFSEEQFGVRRFHFVGDSAGGYLAMLSTLRHSSKAVSASLICGCYRAQRGTFPGVYFERENGLPDYYFDLTTCASNLKDKQVAIITGEKDFLREENILLASLLGDGCEFYDAPDAEGREMIHVFPIGHPDWPEGQKAIEIIASFARKSY